MAEENRTYYPILGCDIGNGYGYISILRKLDEDPISLLPSDNRPVYDMGMPTTAYVTPPDGTPIIAYQSGKDAERLGIKHPECLVRAIKTRLHEGTLSLPGVSAPVSVDSVYSAITRDMLLLAEETMQKLNLQTQELVFTFPAALADSPELDRLQNCIEQTDVNGKRFRVVGRLPEPAAVAIDYLYYMQNLAPENVRVKEDSLTVLVYDLGHGTFDTAVVTARSSGEPYQLLDKDGCAVGGKDFDDLLKKEIARALKKQYDYEPKNDRDRERLLTEAVKTKHELTNQEDSEPAVMIDDEMCPVRITRAQFEELGKPLLGRTLDCVAMLLDRCERRGIKIDGIVLSGGASRMPMVKRALTEMTEGKLPVELYRPSQAVSFGAARYAWGLHKEPDPKPGPNPTPDSNHKPRQSAKEGKQARSNTVMEQLTDYCYGFTVAPGAQEDRVRVLIERGQKRPAVSQTYHFVNQIARPQIRLYRSREAAAADSEKEIGDCESILYIPFDIKPGTGCELHLTLLEDYSVQVSVKPGDGEELVKNSSDTVEKLLH